MNFKLDLKCVLIMFFILIIVHQCFKLWNSEGFDLAAYKAKRAASYAASKKEAAERRRKRKERKKKGIKSKKKKFNVKAWRKSQVAGGRGKSKHLK